MVVATGGPLMGLPVGLLVSTLGIGDCGCMEGVICLIGKGFGSAWWCLHPWNLLHVAIIVRGYGFLKFVGI